MSLFSQKDLSILSKAMTKGFPPTISFYFDQCVNNTLSLKGFHRRAVLLLVYGSNKTSQEYLSVLQGKPALQTPLRLQVICACCC